MPAERRKQEIKETKPRSGKRPREGRKKGNTLRSSEKEPPFMAKPRLGVKKVDAC